MADYTADPAWFDFTQVIGDTLLLQVALADAEGVAHDLTGVTATASVLTEIGGASVLDLTVTVTDAAAGEFEVGAAAADTAELDPGTYRYAVRITWGDGTVRTVLEGAMTARRVAI